MVVAALMAAHLTFSEKARLSTSNPTMISFQAPSGVFAAPSPVDDVVVVVVGRGGG